MLYGRGNPEIVYWTLVVDTHMYLCLVGEPSIKTLLALYSVYFGRMLYVVGIPSIGWCVCFVFAYIG